MKTPSAPKPTQIFISYSTRDRLAVDKLADDLRKRHYPVWMDIDEKGLSPGEEWRKELINQVKASAAVIACVSPDFLESEYCKLEIDTAMANNIPVLPVIVRRVDLNLLEKFALDKIQHVDLTLGYQPGLRKLLGVMPPAPLPIRYYLQRIALGAGGFGALGVLLFLVYLASQQGIINVTPTATPQPTLAPTPTESLARFDVQVAVTPFLIDPQIDATQSDEINDLMVNFSSDLNELENDPDTSVTVGVRTADQLQPIDGETETERERNASAFATAGRYEIVVYGWVTLLEDGQIEIQPVYYIPPDVFPDAVEITGDQRFGKPIRLRRITGGTIANDTIEQLRVRSQALAYVIRGTSFYIERGYDKALQLFERAAELEGWGETEGREVLDVLRANAHWQIARIAISECRPEDALPDLYAAETLYNSAIETVDPPDDEQPSIARAYAGRADVNAILAYWENQADIINCEPQYAQLDRLDSAIEDIELARESDDFLTLPIPLRAQIDINRMRVVLSRWQVRDESDADQISDWERAIENSGAAVLRAYETETNSDLLTLSAFEAYLLRGTLRIESAGGDSCDESGAADFQAAVALPNIPAHRLVFAYDNLGLCAEFAGDVDAAIEYYRAALDNAQTPEDQQRYVCYIAALENRDAPPVPECQLDEPTEPTADATSEMTPETTTEGDS